MFNEENNLRMFGIPIKKIVIRFFFYLIYYDNERESSKRE